MVIRAKTAIHPSGWPIEQLQLDEQNVVVRYQVAINPLRYAFLIRHYNHFCGYALVSPEKKPDIRELNFCRPVTYFGTGSRHISWYRVGENGQLNSRCTVGLFGEQDAWLGFDLRVDESEDFQAAKELLIEFSKDAQNFSES